MSQFVPIDEVIDMALLGNDDLLKRGKGRMRKWAKYVYNDLNISVIKQAIRQEFQINKRTNSVEMPCGEEMISSISVRDRHGCIWPVYKSDKCLHHDIVEIPADKDCNCANKCGYKLCNTIKGYEAVVTVKSDFMPDGVTPVSFTCVDRKAVDANGFLYSQTQSPLRVYTNSVWTDTILSTENTKLCKLETDKHGCICDTEANLNAICHACGWNDKFKFHEPNPACNTLPVGGNANMPPNPADTRWIYFCNSKAEWLAVQCGRHFHHRCENIYNINELGDQVIFPHHFAFDKVIIRWYGVPSMTDMTVPFIAVDTFVDGLKWFDVRWNDKKQQLEPKYGLTYSKSKWGLFQTLNKYTIKEEGMILATPRFMPSYIDHRWDEYGRY